MPSPMPHVVNITSPAEPTSMSKEAQLSGAHKYRGATVEDLDPPPALSVHPHTPVSSALMAAYERDYTHLTVTTDEDRALVGYLSMPRLKELLKNGEIEESDSVEKAMQRFRRKKGLYRTITMDTPLEDLEDFFKRGGGNGQEHDFAVVTDDNRRFVLGVATRSDLEEFVRRRPG